VVTIASHNRVSSVQRDGSGPVDEGQVDLWSGKLAGSLPDYQVYAGVTVTYRAITERAFTRYRTDL